MKTLRIVWVVAALSFATAAARADAVPDPKIIVQGSGYSQGLYGLDFAFVANSTGGGSFDFSNESGIDWTELNISTAMPYGYTNDGWAALDSTSYYTISSELFTSSALSFGTNSLTIHLFGVDDGHGGIPFTGAVPMNKSEGEAPWGSHFSINLDNNPLDPGIGGWLGADHSPLGFDGTANPVPEPGTCALLLGGLLALGLRSRRKKK